MLTYEQIANGRPEDLEEGPVLSYQSEFGDVVALGDELVLGTATGSSQLGVASKLGNTNTAVGVLNTKGF